MWTLVQTVAGDDGVRRQYWLCAGRTYIVGRKEGECDLLVDSDRSLSRAHAEINVTDHADVRDLLSRPQVKVKDTSTYGTFVDGEAVQQKTVAVVPEGGELQFGVFKSIFKLVWMPIVACLSKTSAATKTKLRKSLLDVGGHITLSLKDATHVITDTVNATLICFGALAKSIPIVTCEWVEQLAARPSLRTPPPAVSLFVPGAAAAWGALRAPEPSLAFSGDLFLVNPLRKALFKDRFFVFLEQACFGATHELLSSCSGMSFDESEAALVGDRLARDAFFIRHRCHYVVASTLDFPPAGSGTDSDALIDLKYKVVVLQKMGFTVVEQPALVSAILWANAAALDRVHFPSRNRQAQPQQQQQQQPPSAAPRGNVARQASALTQGRSDVTRLESTLAGGDTQLPNYGTDLLGSLEAVEAAGGGGGGGVPHGFGGLHGISAKGSTLGAPQHTGLLAAASAAASDLRAAAAAAAPSAVGPPPRQPVEDFRTASKKRSFRKSFRAEAEAEAAEPGAKRGRREAADEAPADDDAMEGVVEAADANGGGGAGEEEGDESSSGEEQQSLGSGWRRGRGRSRRRKGDGGDSIYSVQETARLVCAQHGVDAFLNRAFPCYAASERAAEEADAAGAAASPAGGREGHPKATASPETTQDDCGAGTRPPAWRRGRRGRSEAVATAERATPQRKHLPQPAQPAPVFLDPTFPCYAGVVRGGGASGAVVGGKAFVKQALCLGHALVGLEEFHPAPDVVRIQATQLQHDPSHFEDLMTEDVARGPRGRRAPASRAIRGSRSTPGSRGGGGGGGGGGRVSAGQPLPIRGYVVPPASRLDALRMATVGGGGRGGGGKQQLVINPFEMVSDED